MAIRFDRPRSLAIELQFNGKQPNLFSAPLAASRAMEAAGFLGDTAEGGSCNVVEVQLNPHCNGTHSESVGHIVSEDVPICDVVSGNLLQAALVSVRTAPLEASQESYGDSAELSDQVITAGELAQAIDFVGATGRQALIVCMLPNQLQKQSSRYGLDGSPPYFTYEAAQLVSRLGFSHWLVDLPSVDRVHDGGRLLNHHVFWNVEDGTHELGEDSYRDRTITEMIFVADDVIDGLYVLNLQIPAFHLDVAPSRPIVYPILE